MKNLHYKNVIAISLSIVFLGLGLITFGKTKIKVQDCSVITNSVFVVNASTTQQIFEYSTDASNQEKDFKLEFDTPIVTGFASDELSLKLTPINYGSKSNDPSHAKTYSNFENAFKKRFTDQTAIGKLFSFSFSRKTSDGSTLYGNQAVVTESEQGEQKSFNGAIKVSLFVPTELLKKQYSIVLGSGVEDFKATNNFKVEGNFVTYTTSLYNTNFFALIYNNAYTWVYIGIGGFLLILVGAIFWKIRKLHKEDAEYYAQVKKEKIMNKQQIAANKRYAELHDQKIKAKQKAKQEQIKQQK